MLKDKLVFVIRTLTLEKNNELALTRCILETKIVMDNKIKFTNFFISLLN